MKLARSDDGRIVVEVQPGDFPEGAERAEDGFVLHGVKYFTHLDIGRHIDELVQLESAWAEYSRLSMLGR